jgi:hypothetical protein
MSPDTIRCCEIYRAAVAAGEDTTDVVGQLATWFDVQRPAIWKRLRRGGAIPPYAPKTYGGKGRPIGGGASGYSERRRKASLSRSTNRAAMAAAPRVVRDPCPRCGVRGDLPCKHNRTWLGTSF